MTATMMAGSRPKPPDHPVVLKADRMVDVDARAIVEPGVVIVEREHIRDVSPERIPDDAEVIELGDVTLLPGLQLRHTPGHTPGHEVALLRTPDETLALTGDLLLHAAQLVDSAVT